MNLLDKFERSIERLIGGTFAKAFSSKLHPVEILGALKKEMDSHAKVVSRTRILARHSYRILVSGSDFQRLERVRTALASKLAKGLEGYAKKHLYHLASKVSIKIEYSAKLSQGLGDVTSEPLGPVIWVPFLSLQKIVYPITKKTTSIGRASDADIRVNMKGVSRNHVEIRWDGKRAELLDLASTNGTKLDGKVVSRAALPDRCFIEVGKTRILFEIVAKIESGSGRLDARDPEETEER